MNPLANRHGQQLDPARQPPADAPMQVAPFSEEQGRTLGAENADTRFQGDLFLPGWLPIEVQPSAEQGPGA